MCLTFDGQYLISGDYQGLIYIWNISHSEFHQLASNVQSPRNNSGAGGGAVQSTNNNNTGAASTNANNNLLNQKSELIGVGS